MTHCSSLMLQSGEKKIRSYSQAWPCTSLSPWTSATLLSMLRAVLLPGDQRAKLHLEWDVLLIQWLTQPEMALMGAVISPLLLWLAAVASSSSRS